MVMVNLKMIKNSTQASDNEEEKTHLKNSNGDTTLKEDTKKNAGVGKELEKTVTNKSDGDGTSKDKSGDVWNELENTVTNEINREGSLKQDAKNKTGTVGKKFEKLVMNKSKGAVGNELEKKHNE